jgi:DNA-binding IclR family transcriptional regulator
MKPIIRYPLLLFRAAVHVVAPTGRWTLGDARQRLAPAVIDCARGISNSIRALELA